MNWEPCVTCARLRKCADVSASMLLEGGGCSLHESVHVGVTRARLRIMEEFGPSAIPTQSNSNDGVITMGTTVTASKSSLRQLAYTLGVLERGGRSFTLDESALCALIAPKFPNIAAMSDDEVRDLTAGGGKPSKEEPAAVTKEESPKEAPAETPAKRRGRPPGAKAETAAKEEESVESEEAAAPRRTPAAGARTTSRTESEEESAVAGRRPAPARPAAGASRPAPVSDGGNAGTIETMLRVIGTAGDARDEEIKLLRKKANDLETAIAALNDALAGIGAQVELLSAHAAWRYNNDFGEKIANLEDVDWSS